MKDPHGYRVERFEPAELAPEELLRVAELQRLLKHERVVEDPLTPLEMFRSWMLDPAPGRWRAFFKAQDAGGAIVGWGFVVRRLNHPQNQFQRGWEVAVHPAHRRRGVGRALLRLIVEAVADHGENLIFAANATDRVPACERFARAIGATPGLELKTSQLDLGALDREKVARWAALSPAGYRLERNDDIVPPERMATYIQASSALSDMPRGTLTMAFAGPTEEQIRERELAARLSGDKLRMVVAVHELTGSGAGASEVTWHPLLPHVIWQMATGVVAAHRGNRLGIWLKAVLLKRILEECPAAKFLRTGNATSNVHMLALNAEMGFAQAWSTTVWQLTLADARKAVGIERA